MHLDEVVVKYSGVAKPTGAFGTRELLINSANQKRLYFYFIFFQ
jgi:hypothetical protein